MNFNKSFAISPDMRNILPARSNKKPNKNFLAENIKNLRQMQIQMEATKKALDEKAKKEQKPKQRSAFTVTKGTRNPLWVKYRPPSGENVSGRSGSNGSSQSAQGFNEGKAKASLPKQFIDRGVQTSPAREREEKENEESSKYKPQTPVYSTQTYSDKMSPSVISAESLISSPQQPQEISKTVAVTVPIENDISAMKEKATNNMYKENNVNFVEMNRRMEYKRRVTKEKTDPAGIPANYQLGELPRYLKEKRDGNPESVMKREEEPLKAQPFDPSGDGDQGHAHLLSNEERLDHLKKMNDYYKELLLQFNQLPVRCDSLRAKQKRANLEKQLDELEKKMNLFSRGKVYLGL